MERLWAPWRQRVRDRRQRRVHRLHLLSTPLEPGRDELILVRGRVSFRHPQPLSLQQRPPDGGAEPARRRTWRRLTADEQAELMRLTRHAEMALTEAYAPQGINVGINLGRPAGAGVPRSPARAPRAALERRHQLHDRDRRHARAARGARRERERSCGRSSSASPDDAEATQRHEDTKDRRRTISRIFVSLVSSVVDSVDDSRAHTRTESLPTADRAVRARDRRAAGGRHRQVGRVSRRRDARGGGPGAARRHDSESVGRRGHGLRQLRAGDRSDRARQRDRRRVAVGDQLAGRRTDRARRTRSAARAVAAPAGERRGDRRLRAVGAGRRHRRGEPADQGRASRATATASPARRCGSPTPRTRPSAIVFARTRPGLRGQGDHRVSRADGHARHHAHGARRLARCARTRLHGSRAGHHRRRRSGARARRSGVRAGDVGAAGRPRRDRGAGARHRRRRRSTKRSPTRSSASSSVSRSRTTRRFSGCSPTWPPSWPPRGC